MRHSDDVNMICDDSFEREYNSYAQISCVE